MKVHDRWNGLRGLRSSRLFGDHDHDVTDVDVAGNKVEIINHTEEPNDRA